MRTRARLLAALLLALTAGPVLAASSVREPLSFVAVQAPRPSLDLRLDERYAAKAARSVPMRPLPSVVVRPSVELPPNPASSTPRATPGPTVAPSVAPCCPTLSGHHRIAGLASFYCYPANPICHYRYPLGSMVAAACGKLRAAIGPSWRGRAVTVRYGTRRVVVTLVDWCGSASKTIDLYGRPFSKLAPLSAGVVKVTVSW